MSSGPGPSRDTEDIRRAREQQRDLFSSEQVKNPALFVSTDSPLQTLAPAQIDQAMNRLEAIAGAEGSRLIERDWLSLVDSSVSKAENERILLQEGGRLPLDERREARMTETEVDEARRSHARSEILDLCEQIDLAGVDGARVLELVFAEEGAEAADLLAGTDFDEDDVEQLLDAIQDDFGGTFVSDAIAECRDRLAGPELTAETADAEEILDELQDRFGLGTVLSAGEAIDRIEDQIDRLENRIQTLQERGEERAEEAALNRLERGFGQRFDNLDDAVRRLRERMAQERLEIAPVEVRIVSGELRVRIEDGVEFQQFVGPARRRIVNELDIENIPPGGAWKEVGEVRLSGGQLQAIDLEIGRERFGAIAEPQPVPEEQRPEDAEQVELPTPETDEEELADRAIALLEQGQGGGP